MPIVVLVYHKVTQDIHKEINHNLTINHPLNQFISEMQFLKRHFHIIGLDEAVDAIKNKMGFSGPTLAITFDDGFEDNYRLAFPILKELKIPATIFLTAGVIGTNKLPWVDEIGQAILHTKETSFQLNSCFKDTIFPLRNLQEKRTSYGKITSRLKELTYSERLNLTEEISGKLATPKNKGLRMLNWDEVKEMAQNNISFGAHTMTHPILTKMPFGWAKKEILDSKQVMENRLGIPIKHFAFPNGRPEDFNAALKVYCKELGLESVSTAVYGSNQLGQDVYALKRISPGKNMPIFAVDLVRGFLRKNACKD